MEVIEDDISSVFPVYAEDDPPPPSIMDWIKVFEESAQSVPQNKENLPEEVPPIKKKSLFYGSFTLCAGMLFGGMNEYVYEKGHKEELNRLEWEEYFVPCIELCGEFGFWNVFAECAILSAVPVKSSKMRDHDYMLEYAPDILSMFSEHDAMLDGHFELKAAFGYKFNFRRWYIAPAAGFLYRGRKWSAMDGYTQYPSDESSAWTPEVQKKETAGTIITYHEATYMVPVLLKGGFYINDMFELGCSAVYYPYINISTIDTHIMRNPDTRYHDNMEGIRLFSLAGNYIWCTTRRAHLLSPGRLMPAGRVSSPEEVRHRQALSGTLRNLQWTIRVSRAVKAVFSVSA